MAKRRQKWHIDEERIVSDSERLLLTNWADAHGKAASLQQQQQAMMFRLLLNTGIRCQELCDLRIGDLPYAHGQRAIVVRRGKGNRRRSVPISSNFSAAIEEYIESCRPATLPKRYGKKSKAGFLFYIKGKKINTWQVRYRIGKLAQQVQCRRRITPHMFRHRFATCALSADGANIYKVKRWLGHSSLTITERYLHLADMAGGNYGEAIEAVV